MAISIVGTPQSAVANNGGTATITFDVTPQEGDYTVVIIGSPGVNNTVGGPTTSGYTLAVGHAGATQANPSIGVWYKKQGASPDSNVQGTGGNGTTTDTVMLAYVFRGIDPDTPLDNTPTSAGETTSANPNPPAFTKVTSGCLLLCAACMTVVMDTSPGTISGFTGHVQNIGNDTYDNTLAAAYKITTGTGSEDPGAWSTWSSGLWYAVTVGFRPGLVIKPITMVVSTTIATANTANLGGVETVKPITMVSSAVFQTGGYAEETGGLFVINAEDNNLAEWTGYSDTDGPLTTQSTTKAYGNYAFRFESNSTAPYSPNAWKTFSAQTEFYVRFYLYLPTALLDGGQTGVSDAWLFTLRNSGDTIDLFNFGLKNNASHIFSSWSMSLYNEDYQNPTTNFTTDVWHEVVIHWKAGSGSDGGAEVIIDGDTAYSFFTGNHSAYTTTKAVFGIQGWDVDGFDGAYFFMDEIKADSSPVGSFAGGGANLVLRKLLTASFPAVIDTGGVGDDTLGRLKYANAETNDLSQFDFIDDAVDIYTTTEAKLHGTYGYKIPFNGTTNSQYVDFTFTGRTGDTYSRFYIYVPSGYSFGGTEIRWVCQGITSSWGSTIAVAMLMSSGTPISWRVQVGSNYSIPDIDLNLDTWTCIELLHRVNGASSGGQCWIDGESVFSDFTFNLGVQTLDRIRFGAEQGSAPENGAYIYFDDCVMDDAYIGLFPVGGTPLYLKKSLTASIPVTLTTTGGLLYNTKPLTEIIATTIATSDLADLQGIGNTKPITMTIGIEFNTAYREPFEDATLTHTFDAEYGYNQLHLYADDPNAYETVDGWSVLALQHYSTHEQVEWVTSPVYSGKYAIRIRDDGGNNSPMMISKYTYTGEAPNYEKWYRVYMYIPSNTYQPDAPNLTDAFATFHFENMGMGFGIEFDNSTHEPLRWWVDDADYSSHTYGNNVGGTVPTDEWILVEWMVRAHGLAFSDSGIALYINGSASPVAQSFTATVDTNASVTYLGVGIGGSFSSNGSGAGYEIYLDNFKTRDSNDGGRIGPLGINLQLTKTLTASFDSIFNTSYREPYNNTTQKRLDGESGGIYVSGVDRYIDYDWQIYFDDTEPNQYAVVTTEQVYAGNYAVKFSDNGWLNAGSFIGKNFTGAQDKWFRFYLYIPTQPQSWTVDGYGIIMYWDAGMAFGVYADSSGNPVGWWGCGGLYYVPDPFTYSTTNFSLNEWHKIEIKLVDTVSTNPDSGIQVYVDNDLVIDDVDWVHNDFYPGTMYIGIGATYLVAWDAPGDNHAIVYVDSFMCDNSRLPDIPSNLQLTKTLTASFDAHWTSVNNQIVPLASSQFATDGTTFWDNGSNVSWNSGGEYMTIDTGYAVHQFGDLGYQDLFRVSFDARSSSASGINCYFESGVNGTLEASGINSNWQSFKGVIRNSGNQFNELYLQPNNNPIDIDNIEVRRVSRGKRVLVNGSMELDSNWNDYNTPTYNERSTSQVHSGQYSRRIGGDSNQGARSDSMTLITGQEYVVEGWVYVVSGGMGLYQAGGLSFSTIVVNTTGSWIYFAGLAVATDTTGELEFNVTATGSEYFIDDVCVSELCYVELSTGGGTKYITATINGVFTTTGGLLYNAKPLVSTIGGVFVTAGILQNTKPITETISATFNTTGTLHNTKTLLASFDAGFTTGAYDTNLLPSGASDFTTDGTSFWVPLNGGTIGWDASGFMTLTNRSDWNGIQGWVTSANGCWEDCQIGKRYRVTYSVKSPSYGGTVTFTIGNGSTENAVDGNVSTEWQTFTGVILVEGHVNSHIEVNNAGTGDLHFDNIIIEKVLSPTLLVNKPVNVTIDGVFTTTGGLLYNTKPLTSSIPAVISTSDLADLGGIGGVKHITSVMAVTFTTTAGLLRSEKPLVETIATTFSTTAGLLQSKKPVTSVIGTVFSTTALLGLEKPLTLTLDAVFSTIASEIRVGKELFATIATVFNTAGKLGTKRPVIATIGTVFSTAGFLSNTKPVTITIGGSFNTTGGMLYLTKGLAETITVVFNTTAGLIQKKSAITSTIGATFVTTAGLLQKKTAKTLTINAVFSAIGAAIRTGKELYMTVSTVFTTSTPILSRLMPLAMSYTIATTTSATLSNTKSLTETIAGQFTTSGILKVTKPLSAVVTISFETLGGALSTGKTLTSTMGAVFVTSALLGVKKPLASTIAGVFTAQGGTFFTGATLRMQVNTSFSTMAGLLRLRKALTTTISTQFNTVSFLHSKKTIYTTIAGTFDTSVEKLLAYRRISMMIDAETNTSAGMIYSKRGIAVSIGASFNTNNVFIASKKNMQLSLDAHTDTAGYIRSLKYMTMTSVAVFDTTGALYLRTAEPGEILRLYSPVMLELRHSSQVYLVETLKSPVPVEIRAESKVDKA